LLAPLCHHLIAFFLGPAASLFQKEFFELMKNALRPGGMVCTQGSVHPFFFFFSTLTIDSFAQGFHFPLLLQEKVSGSTSSSFSP
jgi:phosphate starvation-inducible membrane PsiE